MLALLLGPDVTWTVYLKITRGAPVHIVRHVQAQVAVDGRLIGAHFGRLVAHAADEFAALARQVGHGGRRHFLLAGRFATLNHLKRHKMHGQ